MPKSFVEALKAKYCEEDDDTSNFIVSFVFTNRPRKNSGCEGDAELSYLTSVVLSMGGVTHAGIPSEGLTSLCPNITDLDLSNNLIGCWHEVISIFRALDNLKFVNLSGNNLKDPKKSLTKLSDVTFGIENLVLNNTCVSWEDIAMVTGRLPCLTELHASKNGYEDIPLSGKLLARCLPRLQTLHLTDNKFTRWEQVACLCLLPKLQTLMLSENPLTDIKYTVEGYVDDQEEASEKMEPGPESSPDECAMEHQEIVDQILDQLIQDTINSTQDQGVQTSAEVGTSTATTSTTATTVADPASYDSGMEDSQPNTPRHDRRHRLASQGSEDGDLYGLADSGFGCTKQGAEEGDSMPKGSPSNRQLLNGGTLPDISEHGAPRVSPRNSKPKRSKHRKLHKHSSPEREAPAEDVETKIDVNTDKFAYFEVTWDADDEAIGHEEDDTPLPGNRWEDKDFPTKEEESMQGGEEECVPWVPFLHLKVLCVTKTLISGWADVEAVRMFPCLESLRIKGIPFMRDLAADERRKLLVASLPKIRLLNGSEIQDEEREKSERFFIRHFHDQQEPPAWIEQLIERHGVLKPIVDVNIGRGFRKYAFLSFIYKGSCIHQDNISIIQYVGDLRKYCAKLVKKHYGMLSLYHVPKAPGPSGLQEYNHLIQDLLPMSRYDMEDGDEIHIDTKHNAHTNYAAITFLGAR
ncbi:uncharacterized protein [Diadema setosum]|uniref:uncharacterized protein n=1 Tax=Diadema setosum TaxID=31175 RepID=UPI003B3A7456